MSGDTTDTDWWTMPLVGRFFLLALLWLMLVVGVIFSAGAVYMLAVPDERDWDQLVGGLVYFPLVWLMGRHFVLGLAVEPDGLLLRRPFFGLGERLPFSEMRWCRAGGFCQTRWLKVKAKGLLPLMVYNPGLKTGEWDVLVELLRGLLEPLGKWRG
jgi:hypothetical protein